MKTYRIEWVDLVSREVLIQAESADEALKMFNNEEGYDFSEITESDVEYHLEPLVGACLEDQ